MMKVRSKQQKETRAIKQVGAEPPRGIRNKKSGKVSKDAISYKGINLLGVKGHKVNEMTDLP